MKIVVAPDKFKGSLTALEAAEAMKKGILSTIPDCNVVLKPMADGGEGTLQSFLKATDSKKISIRCTGPLGNEIDTYYAITKDGTAIIEMAKIAGLMLVPKEKQNPYYTTTYGVGEVILDALNRNCRSFVIGLGGSATNDGGLGMLSALGMDAKDENGQKVSIYGKDLLSIKTIDFSKLDKRLKRVQIKIASDINNPLCGKNGASYVYGPQKGLVEDQIKAMDKALKAFSELVEQEVNRSMKDEIGSGAAGGLGFALIALGGKVIPGAKLVAEEIGLEHVIKDADFVVTGEGRSDEQTLAGKAPVHIAELAKKHNVPAILISGSITRDCTKLLELYAGCFSIMNEPMTLEEAMSRAHELLTMETNHVIHFIDQISTKCL